jgi:hypothetical protein
MDLAKLAIKTDGEALHLRHPVTREPLGEGDKAVTITLVGMDSKEFSAAKREITNRRLRMKRSDRVDADYLEDEAVSMLVACTKAWSNMVFNGEALACTRENVTALYLNPEYLWLREQVDEFIGARENFVKPSPKT